MSAESPDPLLLWAARTTDFADAQARDLAGHRERPPAPHTGAQEPWHIKN